MPLVFYNTLTAAKEAFNPLTPGQVKMYVCGPTVYDHSHIGHARAVLVFDLLYRHLIALGYDVNYVRNLTDVDDKIIKRANEQGVGFDALSERYIQSFHDDMDALSALRPTHEPRATEHIQDMIADISELIDKGYAYEADGDVYYDVTRFSGYGRLSKRDIEEMRAGSRIEVSDKKKNPLDFTLWKKSKEGEPAWDSPWGQGRPGWHTECSVMSHHFLGKSFDIHGGGHDLVFPHHENEVAQAEALGRGFARYWLHNGFVRVNHEKMSKSLKNFFTVKDVLDRYPPEVVRLFLLSKHYRSPIDFSDEALEETRRSLDRAYRALQAAEELGVEADLQAPAEGDETEPLRAAFLEALNDDLNSAKALGRLFEGVKELNRLLDEARGGDPDKDRIRQWAGAVREMAEVFGVLEQSPDQWFNAQLEAAVEGGEWTAERVEALIEQRAQARKEKNWAEADRIRDQLKEAGIVLEDAGGVTRWRRE